MNKKDYYYKLYRKYKENGTITIFDKWQKYSFLNDEYGFNINCNCLMKWCFDLACGGSNALWIRVRKEYFNEKQRYKCCRKFIQKMFDSNDYKFFFTFTLDNKHIKDYQDNPSEFISYVKYFLQRRFTDWNAFVFNIDYGSFNGRLHIHCLLSSNFERLDFKRLQKLYKLGNLNIVKTYNTEFSAITKYINKFTFHSFKNTTLCKCVYSRKKRC